jgi:negative regulator of replication initiation
VLHNAEKRNLAMADSRAGGESTSRVTESASDISRRVFIAWASGTEAALKATLDAQKAGLEASVAVATTAAEHERDALQQIADAAQRAEEAALEAFRTSVRAVEDMIEGKPPARSGR